MDICIYGSGAIGSVVSGHLLRTGSHQVSVVARGAHMLAIRQSGLHLRSRTADEAFQAIPSAVTDDAQTLPPQDYVIVTLKAHDLPAHARILRGLLKPEGTVVFLTNGLPWWWRYGLASQPNESQVLPLLDPQGELWSGLALKTIGGVVYCAAEVTAPGHVSFSGSNRWLLGEPDGRTTRRLTDIVAMLDEASLAATAVPDLRHEVWIKLLHNAPGNPLCALTRLPVDRMRAEPRLKELFDRLAGETARVAAAAGWDISDHLDRLTSSHPVERGVRPSMLQDLLAGRRMELDAILGQLQAFARDYRVETPVLDAVLPLLHGLDLNRGEGG